MPRYFERFEGRQDLIEYATLHNIPVGATKEHSYSEDENLLHISYEVHGHHSQDTHVHCT